MPLKFLGVFRRWNFFVSSDCKAFGVSKEGYQVGHTGCEAQGNHDPNSRRREKLLKRYS